jgi:hypothetical protein
MTGFVQILPRMGRWQPAGLTEGYSPLDGATPLRQALRACPLRMQGGVEL